ncbi:hypothetical protein THMIRHAM_13400 [Thiomicrorhabdus immobilis]|uniref:Uncharacterized protein n=1 Tax=Thiomicrorhabdus immobilis TaxID=2791037 RepID=A0ABM7MDU6_9GAMM|nr:DUF5052 family protein [Thiomicrorhabdus immobilis]BCN93555.1 hypothetical protein THMIRHAM_13400 [Thiomicrorhabdus immobilis]
MQNFKKNGLLNILLIGLLGLTAMFSLTGCEKVANSAKNIQSDWVGLNRTVELYSCMTGKLVKVYRGDVRLNPEDVHGTSLLIDGKKVHTNLCFVIAEVGTKEEPIVTK